MVGGTTDPELSKLVEQLQNDLERPASQSGRA